MFSVGETAAGARGIKLIAPVLDLNCILEAARQQRFLNELQTNAVCARYRIPTTTTTTTVERASKRSTQQ